MDHFDQIVRIPNNLDKDINVELYYSINNALDKTYGLATFSRGAREWKYHIGTLPYLYGIWVNLNDTNKIYSEMNNRLIKFKMDLDDDFHGAVFFNIDPNNKPINIIKSFRIIRDIGLNFLFKSDEDKHVTIDNASYLYDQYDEDDEGNLECNRFPKFIFKI